MDLFWLSIARTPPLVSAWREGTQAVNAEDRGKPTRPRLPCCPALSHSQQKWKPASLFRNCPTMRTKRACHCHLCCQSNHCLSQQLSHPQRPPLQTLNTTLHLALEQKYLYFAQISRGRKFHKKYHICAIFLMEHKQQQS